MKRAESILQLLCLLCLAVFLILAMKPSNAMNQDLGRHLKLGEMIAAGIFPRTNLFSYTYPDFPFLNHHWLSEVVFYLFFKLGGLPLIFILKLALLLLSGGLVFWSAWKRTDFFSAVLSFLIFSPLLLYRSDERPELFGFLLFSLLLLLFFGGQVKDKKKIYLITFLTLAVWVNFHISFVYGVLLFGFYWLNNFRLKRNLTEICLAFPVLGAVFLNPNGLAGVFYPLKIFENYGYSVLENQSVFVLVSTLKQSIFFYCLAIVFLTLVLIVFYWRRENFELDFLLFFVFAVLGFWAVRNFAFLALVGVPTLALIVNKIGGKQLQEKFLKNEINAFLFLLAIILICVNVVLVFNRPYVWGIKEYYKAGVDFFLKMSPPGNIFNNFDIGGYLDYRLYPKYRVFVDNRPEAFPARFFNEYIKIQVDPVFREKKFREYGIKSVIFSRREITFWSQNFLQQMQVDKNWKLAYLDNFLVIFTR